jgi:transposase-like protein
MKPKHFRSNLTAKPNAEGVVKDIKRRTRRHLSAEDNIRLVLEGLRGDDSIAELCRKEGIAQNLYYTWSKELTEAGKRRTRMKLMAFDRSGFVLVLKALTVVKFRWPRRAETVVIQRMFS